jgi:hypothetical protein
MTSRGFARPERSRVRVTHNLAVNLGDEPRAAPPQDLLAPSRHFLFIGRNNLERARAFQNMLPINLRDRGNISGRRFTNKNVRFHRNTIIKDMSRSSKRREPNYYNNDDPQAEQLAWLMDSSIAVGPFRIGLDALIGIIPGLGDLLTSLIGYWIVVRAMRSGVNRAAVMRMVLNLGIDALVGIVPVVGDFFDMAYKANMKNMKIYREAMSGTRAPLKDWGFVTLVVAILLLLLALPIVGLYLVLQWISPYFFMAATAFVSSAYGPMRPWPPTIVPTLNFAF